MRASKRELAIEKEVKGQMIDEHVNEHSLENRMYRVIKLSTTGKLGAWMTWCDPHGHWGPLIEKVAEALGISLIEVGEKTAGDVGSPALRRENQECIERQESFVLHVEATAHQLGWLTAQALRADLIYQTSLREQLKAWRWRPQDGTMSDEQLAQHALLYFQQDLAVWAERLQPGTLGLLQLLVTGLNSDLDDRLLLAIDAAGLPALDAQNILLWCTHALVRLLIHAIKHNARLRLSLAERAGLRVSCISRIQCALNEGRRV